MTVDRAAVTSSYAVAESPRDGLCLSVVSFSSMIAVGPSFIISNFGFTVDTVYRGVILLCSVVLFSVYKSMMQAVINSQ